MGVTSPRAEDDRQRASPDAKAQVQARVQRSGTSFYWAMRLLPRPKKEAMFAIYAFCREVDDVADDVAAPAEKLARLREWRDEIAALYAGRPSHSVGKALLPAVDRFGLRRGDFEAVVAGMEMDAASDIRAPALADLELYCDRVAGAVGLLSVDVFECRAASARDFALATGRALQLTNILRDIREDAGRGRLYVPRELLDDTGIDAQEPDRVLAHEGFPRACAALAEIARRHFREAEALRRAMAPGTAATLWPAVVMSEIYRTVLDRMMRRGWTRFDEPVGIRGAEKLLIALRASLSGS